MCGRYVIKSPSAKLKVKFRLDDVPLFEPRYNVAPTQTVPAVRADDDLRHLTMLRWGLIPSWAKDAKIGYRLINARSETVATKPSFRSAFKKRRCLIAADGFYEWKKLDKGKQPFFIHLKDDKPLAFAGLREIWHDPDGEEVQSCAIITTDANELMKTIHDRMPDFLPPSACDRWLDPDEKPETLQGFLCPYKAKDLEAYPVSTYVNSPKNQGPKCLEPAA
jgi:putative SOS response-associated peptidase YedK